MMLFPLFGPLIELMFSKSVRMPLSPSFQSFGTTTDDTSMVSSYVIIPLSTRILDTNVAGLAGSLLRFIN